VLQELMNLESLKHPYGDSSETIEKFLGLDLSVNSLETVSEESSGSYEDFYDNKEVEAAIPTGRELLVLMVKESP